MLRTINLDGRAVSLELTKEGRAHFGKIYVGNVINTEHGWQATNIYNDVRLFRRQRDALAHICYDCPAFWDETIRMLTATSDDL